MAGEQAIDKTDVVGNIKAEAQTEHTRTYDQAAVQPSETSARIGKGKSESRGNQHHSRDGAHSKNQ